MSATVNPYVETVSIYINVTGDSAAAFGNTGYSSDVTVTIRVNNQDLFKWSDSIDKGETQSLNFTTSEVEIVGGWEILLESNDAASDFTYAYEWYNYYQASS
ncbi:MAG: hypothetical protein CMA77_06070 [Euryarchaeota archaeon]|nr:hypothetical protein [Euryarchaeota archaeon]